MMEDVQKSIIRQSSIKASIDYFKIKSDQGHNDVTVDDVIDVASEIAYYCATGKKYNNNNNKLLK